MISPQNKTVQSYENKQTQQSEYIQEEQMLLQKTRQKINANESDHKSECSHEEYIKQQHFTLKNDYKDCNNLEQEIQRIKKIKNQYNEQKQQIQQLNKIVQNLKYENKSLKIDKDSIREHSQRKQDQQSNRNDVKQNKQNEKQIRQKNKTKGNIVNVNNQMNSNFFNVQSSGVQRYLSPQVGRRITTNSIRNYGLKHQRHDSYNHEIFKIDKQMLIKNHQNNKKTVIASFVEELKQQLEQNQLILQRQKRAHRQTREKLQICIQQINSLKLKLQRQRNYDLLERQNTQIRKQLQIEVQQRLIAEQRLREKQILLSQYQSGYLIRSQQFDRELDKMDQIYFNIQRTIKL